MNIKISLDLALELLRGAEAMGWDCAKQLRAITLLQQVDNVRGCKNCLGRGTIERSVGLKAIERFTCPECCGVQS